MGKILIAYANVALYTNQPNDAPMKEGKAKALPSTPQKADGLWKPFLCQ